MLVLGAASNPWEMLSSLQPLQAASASAPPASTGIGQFLTDGAAPAATSGSQPALPTGKIGQASLSPDVLGFLIWNQSQQPSSTSPATNGTNPAGTDGAAGAATGGSDPSSPDTGANSAAATATSQSNADADPVLAAGQPGTTPESSGTHGHHHHHGGFAAQSHADPSDPLANLLGGSAQNASSTTATNTDGSSTTTITYADGSEVTLSTPGQASSSNATPLSAAAQPSINTNNVLETLIQLQARLLSPTAAA